jgi:lipoteichoic acid synthase
LSRRKTKGWRVLSFLGGFLSRRDRVYPLSLLVPFAVYNLALKVYDVASRPEKLGLARTLKLMRSDVFFNLGYALLWTGLFGLPLPRHDNVRSDR